MRITVDRNVCAGAGLCALTAPEVFDQDEEDGLVRLLMPEPRHPVGADRAVRRGDLTRAARPAGTRGRGPGVWSRGRERRCPRTGAPVRGHVGQTLSRCSRRCRGRGRSGRRGRAR
ncbi:ferredoxin [Nocardiopsis aegyptia]|uniref:ferredoxin n=1 Tax=Nocardiopsis aegyptia TaxID=220378 RepID=UPI0015CDCFA2